MQIIRFVLVALSLYLAAPASAQDGSITTETGAAQAELDAAMATKLRELLQELEDYSDVTVTVNEGIVTLRGTTLAADGYEQLEDLVGRVEGVVAIKNEVTASTDVVERINPAIERFFERTRQIVAFLPLVAVALLAFALIVALGFLLARFRQPWERLAPNAFIAEILRTIFRLIFVALGLVAALDILGATALLSTILGAAGIIGLAISFAVRDTVENFIASILLSIRQPFRPNDAVEIGGDEGKVIRLTSRATIILSWDGNHIRIPNATVYKSRIVNYSRNPERRFDFEIGVAYGTDLAHAADIAEHALKSLPFVLETPAVNLWTTDLGGSSVGMKLTAWIDQRETGLLAARSEAIRHVLMAFAEEGIDCPEPTYRVLMQDSATAGRVGRTGRSAGQPVRARPHVEDVAANLEKELETMAAAERAETGDLLNSEAPEE